MHKLRKSDTAIFNKNKFVGCRRSSLFQRMIMIIEIFPIIPISIIRNITIKKKISKFKLLSGGENCRINPNWDEG